MKVRIRGKTYRLNPREIIGSGGEADIYRLSNKRVFKVFKSPDHPDIVSFPDQVVAAEFRIREQQHKLASFPDDLPSEVVAPSALGIDQNGLIIGYQMKYIPHAMALGGFGKKSNRINGISNAEIVSTYIRLIKVVEALHRKNVVIGDCNDQNILVNEDGPHLIDCDSFQFGQFPCRVFTEDYVDPILCDVDQPMPVLISPHTHLSDWYAIHVMLFRCLLLVHPFGGIHKPSDSTKRIPPRRRSLHRVSVFDSDVQYPKPAFPLATLPDEWLHHFHAVFAKDKRQALPSGLLQGVSWKTCSDCGCEHARQACPGCRSSIPSPSIAETVRGRFHLQTVAETSGHFLMMEWVGGQLRFLAYENGKFIREDSTVVFQGEPSPSFRFGLTNEGTVIAKCRDLALFGNSMTVEKREVDFSVFGEPVFAATGRHLVFANHGTLYCRRAFGDEALGTVLSRHCRIWLAGNTGFGIQTAGSWRQGFLFDPRFCGINDGLVLPTFGGRLVDSQCVIGDLLIWVALTVHRNNRNEIYLVIYDHHGQPVGENVFDEPGSWVESLQNSIANKTGLLVPTAKGLIRVEVESGVPRVMTKFPDSVEFIDESTQLFGAGNSVLAAGPKRCVQLSLV